MVQQKGHGASQLVALGLALHTIQFHTHVPVCVLSTCVHMSGCLNVTIHLCTVSLCVCMSMHVYAHICTYIHLEAGGSDRAAFG